VGCARTASNGSAMARRDAQHDEVVTALRALGNATLGAAVQRDRGSQLVHLGVRVPVLRRRVRQGFSFTAQPAAEALQIWDRLWQSSPYADVLFAAIEHYAPIVRKQVPPGLWPVLRTWVARVDNWCHADALSTLLSRVLAAEGAPVYRQLVAWNRAQDLWPRRISLTSLVHYTGQHAVFLTPAQMTPFLARCASDPRKPIQQATGWVLRELGRAHPAAAIAFIEQHVAALGSDAFARAIERQCAREQERLRALRAAAVLAEAS